MEVNEQRGIQAIIALQKMAGITETEDAAKTGWAAMSERERKTTVGVWQSLGGELRDKDEP